MHAFGGPVAIFDFLFQVPHFDYSDHIVISPISMLKDNKPKLTILHPQLILSLFRNYMLETYTLQTIRLETMGRKISKNVWIIYR